MNNPIVSCKTCKHYISGMGACTYPNLERKNIPDDFWCRHYEYAMVTLVDVLKNILEVRDASK